MGQALKYDDAADFWCAHHADDNLTPLDSERLIDAEIEILDHVPDDTREIKTLLSVLIENVLCGPRSDGRDARALQGLIHVLHQSELEADAQRAGMN